MRPPRVGVDRRWKGSRPRADDAARSPRPASQPAGDLAQSLSRAWRELPSGGSVERLRNYCGRVWEVLCTPAFADAFRRSVGRGRGRELGASELPRLVEGVLADVSRLIAAGVATGELRSLPQGPVARLLVSSMLVRALWCTRPGSLDPRVAGTCTRVVAETLELILHAMATAHPTVTHSAHGADA